MKNNVLNTLHFGEVNHVVDKAFAKFELTNAVIGRSPYTHTHTHTHTHTTNICAKGGSALSLPPLTSVKGGWRKSSDEGRAD